MRVKQRMRINTVVMVLSVVAILFVIFLAARRVGRAMEQNRIADALITAQFQRLAFRTDYIRTGSERALEQVRARFRQVDGLLKSASEAFMDPEDKRTIDELIKGQESIGKIMPTIVTNRKNAETEGRPAALAGVIEDRLLSQLDMRVYEAVLLGGRLQDSSNTAFFSALKEAGEEIFLVLVLVSTVTLINSWTMGRAITDRVGRLREGVALIGGGDLDHRIEVRGGDEFAELSEAFNAMTAKLRGSYNDHETEIEVRREAEKALQDANDELAKQAEERTRELHEKEVLLKEIHHRVKNNLQVISSLVGLQADGSEDDTVRGVLRDVTDRVRSMALVHEKLYQSTDLSRIDFAEYVRSLLGYLWRAHGSTAASVRLNLDLEPVLLPVDTAVPCGLILNELAGNALKHAFRGRDGGEVTVSLRERADGRIYLCVGDNGVGLPAGLDWRQARSLGLRLVNLLACQLEANVEAVSAEGTQFEIGFRLTV